MDERRKIVFNEKLYKVNKSTEACIYYRCSKFASGLVLVSLKKEVIFVLKMIQINWRLKKLLQTQAASPILLYVKNPQDSNYIPIKFMKIYC
ncbi:hypothetical protein HZS_7470 [Henneguya salminicola]|nr:hypothetical protein HZS_7470 [Henneguya salminicola]